ncbi:ELWxxDGT repeat protein [Nocardioides nitrophenolicus]|uniref:ELWxxDGT repeat protein n=1 Tax=Nocardioides nitrophenolicus TaxID=60489 RepID=UPI0019573E53|nr:ELWxxDGT repeat protein [Nocardioides nitrophenolicus]MBM7517735.1 ELWxxDGT repeat protein [Nocardioides nitrophenolicus]
MTRLPRLLGSTLTAAAVVSALAAPTSATPGAAAAAEPFGPGPVPLTAATYDDGNGSSNAGAVLGDGYVFRAGTAATGQELWVTDGTPAGTRLLADIWPGASSGFPDRFASFQGRVFFAATDGTHGYELWVTDGTAAGTRMVKDINLGAEVSSPDDLVVSGGRLFFAAADRENGKELWVSDGTAAGTVLAVDVNGGRNSSGPRRITPFRNGVVFAASPDTLGRYKPFFSDGTQGGTVRLDPLPLDQSVNPLEFVELGGRLLLTVYTEQSGVDLWTSNGAAGDGVLVKDINPGGDDGVAQLTRLGNRLVLTAKTAAAGYELWTTDGTAGGTQLLRDIKEGPQSATPSGYQVVGGRAWFVADDGVHGAELWSTDGTPGGTVLARDATPGAAGSEPDTLGLVGARALFSLNTPGAGDEPWVVEPDGTLRPLGDLDPGATGSNAVPMGSLGNTWLFAASGVPGGQVFAATLQPSSVQASAKRRYAAVKARKKRIRVKVAVSPGVTGGFVEVVRKGRVVGRAVVVNGTATVRITKRLRVGRHRLRAVYRGSVWAQSSPVDRLTIRVRR